MTPKDDTGVTEDLAELARSHPHGFEYIRMLVREASKHDETEDYLLEQVQKKAIYMHMLSV